MKYSITRENNNQRECNFLSDEFICLSSVVVDQMASWQLILKHIIVGFRSAVIYILGFCQGSFASYKFDETENIKRQWVQLLHLETETFEWRLFARKDRL